MSRSDDDNDDDDDDTIGTLAEVLLYLPTTARERRNKRFTSLEPVSRTAASVRFRGFNLAW